MGRVIAFSGPYAGLMEEYVRFRQGLGFAMPESSQRTLGHIADYLSTLPEIPEVMDRERAEAIAAAREGESAPTRAARYIVLRQLCIYLRRKGFDAWVPPAGGVRGRSQFVPRIVTEEEMARIIAAAERGTRIWPPIVLRILWCTGMRIGEAAALRVGDFSAERRTIYIEHAKHDRSRIIPASGSLADALSRHIAAHAPASGPDSWLFPGKRAGTHHSKAAMGNKLHSIYREAGVLDARGNPIRTHDIRHSFAVKALSDMADRGQDVRVALPLLSAYMG